MAPAGVLLVLLGVTLAGAASPSPHGGAASAGASPSTSEAANVTDMPEASVGGGVKPSQAGAGDSAGTDASGAATRVLTIGLAVGGLALVAVGVAAVALGRRRAAAAGEGGRPPRPATAPQARAVLRRTVAATHIRSSTTTVEAGDGVDRTAAVPTGGSAWSDLAWTAGSTDFDAGRLSGADSGFAPSRRETVDEELEVLAELELDLHDLHQSAQDLQRDVEGRGVAEGGGGGARRRISQGGLPSTGTPPRGGGGQGEDV